MMNRSSGARLICKGWLGLLGFLGYFKVVYEPLWVLHLMFLAFGLFLLGLNPKYRTQAGEAYGEGPRTQDQATKVMALPLVRPPAAWGLF
jgi:hypothetical protein